MGKRELLIAIGFLAAGLAAYWLAAPPNARPVLSHSLPAMVDEWKQNAARTAARETVQTIGTRALDRQVSEVRVTGFTRVHVIAEERADVSWTLSVEANGPTPEAARAAAGETTVVEDDLGADLALAPKFGSDTRQTTELTIRTPLALAVRLEGARRVAVDRAAAVRLEGIVGDVTLRTIAGAVTGSHRNGAIEVSGAGEVNLNLNGSRATLANVAGTIALNARNGECRLVAPAGATTIEAAGVTVAATEPRGSVRANVNGGSIEITEPRESVHVDARRARIDLTLDRAVPVTLVGTETAVRVTLAGAPAIDLDASITNGTIDASGIGLAPETVADGARLAHTFGSATHATVRATRGAIVIARRK